MESFRHRMRRSDLRGNLGSVFSISLWTAGCSPMFRWSSRWTERDRKQSSREISQNSFAFRHGSHLNISMVQTKEITKAFSSIDFYLAPLKVSSDIASVLMNGDPSWTRLFFYHGTGLIREKKTSSIRFTAELTQRGWKVTYKHLFQVSTVDDHLVQNVFTLMLSGRKIQMQTNHLAVLNWEWRFDQCGSMMSRDFEGVGLPTSRMNSL